MGVAIIVFGLRSTFICVICCVVAMVAHAVPPDPNISDVILNEVLFNPGNITPSTSQDCDGNGSPGQEGRDEFVELLNTGTSTVNLEGYCFTNRSVTPGATSPTDTSAWLIPPGTTIAPGELLNFCGALSFSQDDPNGDQVTFFNNTSINLSFVTLYQPVVAGDCTNPGVGGDVDSVVFSIDYDQTAEANGQPFALCDSNGDGMATYDFHVDSNGDFFLPSIGSANCTVSLPVTLSRIQTKLEGVELLYSWETETETLNVGFHLWGEVEGDWIRLNDTVIASEGTESLSPKRYRQRVRIGDLPSAVTAVGISSVDISGREQFYGPFGVGESMGKKADITPIPWAEIDAQASARQSTSGQTLSSAKSQAAVSVAGNALSGIIAAFHSVKTGIHRITHNDLVTQGVDLTGVSARTLALTHNGEGVARKLKTQAGKWFNGSFLEWVSTGVDDSQALHTLESVYRLEIAPDRVIKAGVRNTVPDTVARSHRQQIDVNQQIDYGLLMPQPDPWYQAYVASFGSTRHADMVIDTDAVLSQAGGTFSVSVIPITDFIAGTDHHIQILHIGTDTNGHSQETVLGEASADGYGVLSLDMPVAAGVLTEGQNLFRLKLLPIVDANGNPPAGYLGSALYLDRYSLTYRRKGQAQHNQASFTGPGAETTPKDGYEVRGFSAPGVVAYAHSDNVLTRLKVTRTQTPNGHWTAHIPEVVSGKADYYLSAIGAIHHPTVSIPAAIDPDTLDMSGIDYLIISHPVFIDRLLNPQAQQDDFIAAKQDQGYSVKVIDVETIMQVMGHGQRTPQAIKTYITQTKADNPSLKHILLVGYASRDPHNYLNRGSWDFIPTLYAQTHPNLHFAPSDGLFTDLDDDGIQDISLGRWPVRTIEDLDTLIAKTLKYQTGGTNRLNKAVLSADSVDADTGLNFSHQMDRLSESLPGWRISKTYKDQDTDQTTDNLISAINQGQTITAYAGHGSPGQWSYNGVLGHADVDNLHNHDTPTVVLPLTCYTTYYVNEHLDTLGNQLLISTAPNHVHSNPDRGAVALFGASTLSGYGDNEALTRKLLEYWIPSQNHPNPMTLGEAIVKAKHDIGLSPATTSGNLLGDPTISIGR